MPDKVVVEVTIAALSETVWDAVRDPAKIYNWFGWDAATLKDEIDFIFVRIARPDIAAKVLRFEGDSHRFELVHQDRNTLLRVVRTLADGETGEGVYEDITEGWISFVEQLRLALEQHELGPRRTIHLNGSVLTGGQAPLAALGLESVAKTPPGQPANAILPTGERIEGRAWHRSPWQFGLTVPQWGDGLLIVTDKPATEKAPYGRGRVVATTYGLSDAAFADLEKGLTDWWSLRFV